jgi:choline dehydrogenase-like flavoprotein
LILDFRELDNHKELEFDLCIIGAGAAGITIAREFIGSNTKVCCVESGGLFLEEETQSLYDGENVGLPYSLYSTRLRFFGGSTNHWTGHCKPLNEADFTERSWVPHSGWPITRKIMDPFYERAQKLCELGAFIYDERLLEGLTDARPIDWLPEKLINKFWQASPPTRFGIVYKEEIEKATNVTVLLNANVTNLSANNTASSLDDIQIATLEGKVGRIKAKKFVLACGGIENVRILLNSNGVVPQGLGNQNDLVGRFFMEHIGVTCGTLVAKDTPDHFSTYSSRPGIRFTSPILHNGQNPVDILIRACLSDQLQQKERLLNCAGFLNGKWDSEHGISVARELRDNLKNWEIPDDFWKKVWQVMKDLDEVAIQTYQGMFNEGETVVPPKFTSYNLYVTSEQAPNFDSRVKLSEDKDQLGMKKVQLDWRLTKLDKRTLQELSKAFGTELGRLNLARLKIEDWLLSDDNDWPPTLGKGNHHMGTTRMSDDPKKGVVDKNCRLHGMDNLYIAGSSVFPTGGYSPPTLTIVALGVRLADHLKDAL